MAEMTQEDVQFFQAYLEGLECFDEGKFNDRGKELLAYQLENWLPERHGAAFEPIKRKAGPVVAVEAVIIHEGQVLLEWRLHPVFGEGWHTPGTYPKESETFIEAVVRCARDETGLEVRPFEVLKVFDQIGSPRFRDAPILYRCQVVGGLIAQPAVDPEKPVGGDCAWFEECPPNMLPIQQDYAPYINEAIRHMWHLVTPQQTA